MVKVPQSFLGPIKSNYVRRVEMSIKQKLLLVLSGCIAVSFLSVTLGLTEKKVTVDYGMWGKEQLEGVKEQVRVFEKDNPNIKVDVHLIPWGQYWVKLETSIAAGTCWDTFWINASSVGKFGDAKAIVELTPLIKRDEVDLSVFPSVSLETGKWGEKYYFIPRDFDTIGLLYNRDMFDEAGVKYPNGEWTWMDLFLVGTKLTKTDTAGKTITYGFTAGSTSLETIQSFLYPFAVTAGHEGLIEDEKNLAVHMNTLPMRFAACFGRELTKSGISPRYQEIEAAFMAKKSAMSSEGSWMLGYYWKNITAFEWGISPLPKYLTHGNVTNSLGNVIYSGTEHPEEAWEFVKWLAGEEAEKILGRTGSVIPAHSGAMDDWRNFFPEDFRDDVQVFFDNLKFSSPFGSIPGGTKYQFRLQNYYLKEIYAGNMPVVEGLEQADQEIRQIIEEATETW